MANIDTVNQWFETGDYPTEAQFRQKHAWLRWKDELLQITDVQGLQGFVNSIITLAAVKVNYVQLFALPADGFFVMPINMIISGLIVDAPEDTALSIGTTPGGNDIVDAMEIIGGTPEPVTLLLYAKNEKYLYFSGITALTNFIILKNSL